jgi:hypothetical protein
VPILQVQIFEGMKVQIFEGVSVFLFREYDAKDEISMFIPFKPGYKPWSGM